MSAALAIATPAQRTLADLDLPPDWKPDRTLKALILAPLDWRCFRKLPIAERYAISVVEPVHVYDLQKQRTVAQFNSRENRRLRVRLNRGKLDGVTSRYLSRLVLSVTDGVPHQKRMEAHHKDGDTSNNGWRNLSWITPQRNKKIERHRPTGRAGRKNPNCRLYDWQLERMIFELVLGLRTLEGALKQYRITRQHLRRLLKGESRAQEVYDAFKKKGFKPPYQVALAVEDPKVFAALRAQKKTRKPRAKKSKRATVQLS